MFGISQVKFAPKGPPRRTRRLITTEMYSLKNSIIAFRFVYYIILKIEIGMNFAVRRMVATKTILNNSLLAELP